jgi:hypothetical protein
MSLDEQLHHNREAAEVLESLVVAQAAGQIKAPGHHQVFGGGSSGGAGAGGKF